MIFRWLKMRIKLYSTPRPDQIATDGVYRDRDGNFIVVREASEYVKCTIYYCRAGQVHFNFLTYQNFDNDGLIKIGELV